MALRKFSLSWLSELRRSLPRIPSSVPSNNVDWSQGDMFYKTVTVDTTFTFSNVADGMLITLVVRNTSIADCNIALPNGLYKPEGLNLVVAPSGENTYVLMHSNGKTYVSAISRMQPALGSGSANGYAIFLTPSTTLVAVKYVTIATDSDAQDFGNLIEARSNTTAFSSAHRAIVVGGLTSAGYAKSMEAIALHTQSNANFFGNLGYGANGNLPTGASNGIKGIVEFQNNEGLYNNLTFYAHSVNIATYGDSTNFALPLFERTESTAISNPTKCLFIAGYVWSLADNAFLAETQTNMKVEQFLFANQSQATNYGDTYYAYTHIGATGDSTRFILLGKYAGADANYKSITYGSFSSNVGMTAFGDLTNNNQEKRSGTSNKVKGVFSESGSVYLQKITIQTLGNASNFGNLNTGGSGGAASDSHGGI